MNSVKIGFLGFLIAAVLAAGATCAYGETVVVKKGKEVPDFSVKTLDGKTVSFAKDIKGKKDLTVLVFMQTACAACANEMDLVGKFAAENKEKVAFYAVATDMAGAKTVKPYSERHRSNATYLLDPDFKVPALFGFSYTPSLAAVAKDGTLVFKFGGYGDFTRQRILNQLEAAVK
jgi:peroxiredoxin